MAGGLMNLISYGSANVILNGNPSKTFFKAKYAKYSNFGMQRIRMDYSGLRNLSYNSEVKMQFKIPRYGDLLHDTFIVVDLPDIWSPLYLNKEASSSSQDPSGQLIPYEFRWVENLGCAMIKEISIHSAGTILNRYSGEYLYMVKERDYSESKKKIWNRMIGNTDDMTNPEKYHKTFEYDESGRKFETFRYPSIKANNGYRNQPSIKGKQLYIPLGAWFTTSSKMALPLVAIQYQEIYISITFNPIKHLYKIRDVTDISGQYPFVQPKIGQGLHEIKRFLNEPLPSNFETGDEHPSHINHWSGNIKNEWNANIHLIGNFIFLDKQEQAIFARDEQTYLFKEVHEEDFINITGSRFTNLLSQNMLASWMFRFRRTDAYLRNEWFNYSNWKYKDKNPSTSKNYLNKDDRLGRNTRDGSNARVVEHPDFNSIWFWEQPAALDSSGEIVHTKEILIDLAIQMDGKYREDIMTSGIYKWMEKFTRSKGCNNDGIYCYNFGLNSNIDEIQPSGGMNVNTFHKISLEFNTILPPTNPDYKSSLICDEGVIIGIDKPANHLYLYNFDLRLVEERYNVIVIQNGNIGLLYAR